MAAVVSRNTQETETIAREFIERILKDGARQWATVVALSGDLGAGKTTFTQACARILGVQESITSPTFVIENIYSINKKPFTKFIHIDAYRLNSAQELKHLGWNDIIHDPAHLIFIEWPERVQECLPDSYISIQFSHISPEERSIDIAYE